MPLYDTQAARLSPHERVFPIFNNSRDFKYGKIQERSRSLVNLACIPAMIESNSRERTTILAKV